MEKTLNLWLKYMNRKYILIDGSLLYQTTLNLYEDFSKGSPKTNVTDPLTTSKGCYTDPGICLNRKHVKINGEAVSDG